MLKNDQIQLKFVPTGIVMNPKTVGIGGFTVPTPDIAASRSILHLHNQVGPRCIK